jgi:CheY-like chemotaxis protein
VQGALAPFRSRGNNDIIVDGDRIRLTSKFGQSMALVLHELVTNAVKHGALSVSGGVVNVGWSRVTTADGEKIAFSWKERGGPHCFIPERKGFGLAVIRSAASECGGVAHMLFEPEGFEFEFQGDLSTRTQLVGTRHVAIVPRGPVPAANIPASGNCRILLIEDEALIAMQLKLDLEAEGHTVVGPIATLSEGLRAAAETNFDIALLDINLGADNSAPIAEILDRRMIPFAFTTGYNDLVFLPPRLREHPHLKKPYNPADVKDLVRMLSFRASDQRAANASNQVA